ncbi:MAG TPA: hypothetical protein VLT83_12215 [Opitutaceae bacterium]|nr:hypothetical protein [Opitutaceae bacterium]
MSRAARISAIVLNVFLAITAVGGGLGLLTGANAPPVAALGRSPFKSYLIPGLALVILVGGSAAIAATLLVRRHRFARPATLVSAAAIILFEAVEIAAIGSPAGLARNLQILYLATGGLIGALALASRHLGVQSSAAD